MRERERERERRNRLEIKKLNYTADCENYIAYRAGRPKTSKINKKIMIGMKVPLL
jgi:hypothetical protein